MRTLLGKKFPQATWPWNSNTRLDSLRGADSFLAIFWQVKQEPKKVSALHRLETGWNGKKYLKMSKTLKRTWSTPQNVKQPYFTLRQKGQHPPRLLLLRGPERGESRKEPWKGGWIIVLKLYCTTRGPNFSSSTPSPLNFISAFNI